MASRPEAWFQGELASPARADLFGKARREAYSCNPCRHQADPELMCIKTKRETARQTCQIRRRLAPLAVTLCRAVEQHTTLPSADSEKNQLQDGPCQCRFGGSGGDPYPYSLPFLASAVTGLRPPRCLSNPGQRIPSTGSVEYSGRDTALTVTNPLSM